MFTPQKPCKSFNIEVTPCLKVLSLSSSIGCYYFCRQIHKDIRSQQSVAIHWGTFPLTEEGLNDPPKQLKLALSKEEDSLMPFVTIQHGGTLEVAGKNTEEDFGNDSFLRDKYDPLSNVGVQQDVL